MSWVSRILDTTGGLGDQDTGLVARWVTRILNTAGELGEQDTGYYW